MRNVLLIAGKEFRDDFRNRWIVAIATLFASLSLGIAYFGGAVAGKVGFTTFPATLASLTTLGAFLIPLIGLLIAYDMVAGESDGGTLLLMLSYPISRGQLIGGKLAGHSGATAVATLVGFGLAVGVMQAIEPSARSLEAWLEISNFIVSAAMLGASFIGFGCLISVIAEDKSRAAGIALITWIALVVLFDLCLLALLVITGGNRIEQQVFPFLLLLNPIDVFRLINLSHLSGGAGNDLFLGMTAAHVYQLPSLYAILLGWVVVPAGSALHIFKRKEV